MFVSGRKALKQGWLVAALALALSTTAAAESKCDVGQIAALPVTMVGLRPEVRVKINGKDAVFTADSGAWYSLISPGSAAELGLKVLPLPPGFFAQGVGGTFTPGYTIVDTFTIAGVAVPRVQFIVGGSEVGSVGLLGQNVLALADTEFDLANGVIRLMRSKHCRKTALAYWTKVGGAYSVLETESMPTERPHIVASIYVNGVKLRATFDTGAATSFVSLKAAARVGLKPDAPGVVPAGVTGGLGRSFVSTWIGPVQSVKIGDEEIRNTRLRFGGELPDTDILLGADFFLSHRIYWSNTLHKLFFTFNGGHVFDLRYLGNVTEAGAKGAPMKPAGASVAAFPAAADDGLVPTDAEGFSRRGAAHAVRGDVAGAFADFDRAIDLAPDNIEYLRQRARLHARMRQTFRAANDIDRLLKLKPDDIDALLMRAGMRLALDPKADVRSDVDAAAAAASKSSDYRLQIGNLYEEIGAYADAIAQLDLWIAAHPQDNRRATALNSRCWARALANVDLQRALKDCNSALSRNSHDAAYLDSRGLVRLRMRDYPRAIADYDEALKARPNQAWSLYGRGIAKLRSGRKTEGEADIARAKSLDKDLEAKAKKLDILP